MQIKSFEKINMFLVFKSILYSYIGFLRFCQSD